MCQQWNAESRGDINEWHVAFLQGKRKCSGRSGETGDSSYKDARPWKPAAVLPARLCPPLPSNASRARARVGERRILPASLPRPLHVPRPIAYRVTRWTFTALTPYRPPVISSRDHVSFSL